MNVQRHTPSIAFDPLYFFCPMNFLKFISTIKHGILNLKFKMEFCIIQFYPLIIVWRLYNNLDLSLLKTDHALLSPPR